MGLFRTLTVFAVGIFGGICFGTYKDALWNYFDLDVKKQQLIDWTSICEEVEEEKGCHCLDGEED